MTYHIMKLSIFLLMFLILNRTISENLEEILKMLNSRKYHYCVCSKDFLDIPSSFKLSDVMSSSHAELDGQTCLCDKKGLNSSTLKRMLRNYDQKNSKNFQTSPKRCKRLLTSSKRSTFELITVNPTKNSLHSTGTEYPREKCTAHYEYVQVDTSLKPKHQKFTSKNRDYKYFYKYKKPAKYNQTKVKYIHVRIVFLFLNLKI